MAEFKLVIGDPKSKKCFQREVKDDLASSFLGKKIGEKMRGESIDLTGYEFEITGGSDYCGFPMRKDVPGQGRKRILSTASTGIKALKKKRRKNKVFQKFNSSRQRRIVCGNTIHEKIHQINLKVLKAGKASLDIAEAPAEGDAPKEEVKAEAKTEKKKEEAPKVEEKKEEPKPEEKPKEEPKKEEAPKVEKEKAPKEEVKEEKVEEKPAEEVPKKEEAKVEEKKEVSAGNEEVAETSEDTPKPAEDKKE
jgi:small subunit ribosomal protein S6e